MDSYVWFELYFPWQFIYQGSRSKVFLYVDLYRRKNILIDTTGDRLFECFIYMPHNEFRAGRDGFHAPSETFICPYMHATQ